MRNNNFPVPSYYSVPFGHNFLPSVEKILCPKVDAEEAQMEDLGTVVTKMQVLLVADSQTAAMHICNAGS